MKSTNGVVHHCFTGACYKSQDPPDEEECLCECAECAHVNAYNVEMHDKVLEYLRRDN